MVDLISAIKNGYTYRIKNCMPLLTYDLTSVIIMETDTQPVTYPNFKLIAWAESIMDFFYL